MTEEQCPTIVLRSYAAFWSAAESAFTLTFARSLAP